MLNLSNVAPPSSWKDSFDRTLPDFRSQCFIENCNDKVVKYMKKQDFGVLGK